MNLLRKISVVAFLLSLFAASAAAASQSAASGNADVELFARQNTRVAALKNIFPANVKTIACIAPGSYPGKAGYKQGIKLLRRAGYKVKVMPHTFEKNVPGEKSAPLKHRLSDFYQAWNDPEVDMILCVRGGRGCQELMNSVDWSKLPRRPELYVQGYSDVTMILCALLKHGYGRPTAGPMVGGLPSLQSDALLDMHKMHRNKQVGPFAVEELVPGDCQGPVLAGLLARFSWVVNTTYRPPVKGRIIFIESVSADLEKIRQQFQTLLDARFFDGAAGVVFGSFTRTGDDQAAQLLLKEFAPKLGVPVYNNFPFGHTRICRTIDFKRQAIIKNNQVTFPPIAAEKK